MSSDTILWLEKDGQRWGLEPRGNDLRWEGSSDSLALEGIDNAVRFPLGADINDSRAPITPDEAVALIRKHAPGFGYVVRERVVAGAWDAGSDRVYATGADWLASRVGPAGWTCWLGYDDNDLTDPAGDASGPETGPAGMAAADVWLTEHAPWVTLEGGAYTVPGVVPEPVAPTVEPARDPRTNPRPGDVLWIEPYGAVEVTDAIGTTKRASHKGGSVAYYQRDWESFTRGSDVLRVAP